jgi:hypothetical protein
MTRQPAARENGRMAHHCRFFCACVLLALAGCATSVPRNDTASACDKGESSYDCQVERYLSVNHD